MAILPKLVGLSYKEISLQGIAPDSVYTNSFLTGCTLSDKRNLTGNTCLCNTLDNRSHRDQWLSLDMVWESQAKKISWKLVEKEDERTNKCQKPAQKLITAQRHSKACAEEYMPSPPLGHYHSKKYPICSEGLHYCRSRKMAFGLFVGAIALWYHVSAFCFLLSYFVSQLWTSTIKSIAGKREGRRGYWKVVAMRTQSVELWWTFTGG